MEIRPSFPHSQVMNASPNANIKLLRNLQKRQVFLCKLQAHMLGHYSEEKLLMLVANHGIRIQHEEISLTNFFR